MNIPELRPLASQDLAALAEIHLEAFPDDTRSRLGRRVVVRYFEEQLTVRKVVLGLGAFEPFTGRLLGYCCGGLRDGAPDHFYLRHAPLVASRLALRPGLLLRRTLYAKVLERTLRGSGVLGDSPQHPPGRDDPAYEIFSLAVRRASRNLGIGKRLMEQQELFAWQHGSRSVTLTAPTGRPATVAFYEGLGYAGIHTGTTDWRGAMYKRLSEPLPLPVTAERSATPAPLVKAARLAETRTLIGPPRRPSQPRRGLPVTARILDFFRNRTGQDQENGDAD